MAKPLLSASLFFALILLPMAGFAQSTSKRVSKAEVLSSDLFPGTSDSERVYTANIETCREMIEENSNLRFKWELNAAFDDTSLLYGLKVQRPSQSCNTGSADEENDEDCIVIESSRSVGSEKTFQFEIDAQEIFGLTDPDACEGRKENYDVIFVLPYVPAIGEGGNTKTHEPDVLRLTLQTQRPAAPTHVSVTPGGSSIQVRWEASTTKETDHVVYVSQTPLSEGDVPEVLQHARRHIVSAGTSLRVTSGIEPEKDYYVGVTARDSAENESLLSAISSVTTENTIDFWEDYLNHGGKERGGYCSAMSASDGGLVAFLLGIGLLWRRGSRRRAGCDA